MILKNNNSSFKLRDSRIDPVIYMGFPLKSMDISTKWTQFSHNFTMKGQGSTVHYWEHTFRFLCLLMAYWVPVVECEMWWNLLHCVSYCWLCQNQSKEHLCYGHTGSMHHLNHSCLTFQLHETFTRADSNRMHAQSIPPPSPLPTQSKESAYLGEKRKRQGEREGGLFK